MTKFLSDKGRVVSALDISVNALDRVKNFVTGSYNQPSDLPDKTFGLVMHHLVAQHMSDTDLVVQMSHLIRSLTPNGVVAMQFASTVMGEPSASNQSTGLQATGGVTRSPKEMEALVGQAGGSVLSTTPREVFTQSQYWIVKFK